MTGTRSRTAVSIASTMCRHPSYPRAPPILVPSVANAITGAPVISPRAYCTPEVSFGRNRRREPWSKSDRRRSSGSRWSTGAESVDVAAVMLMAATSVSGEEQRDVVTAEAERVVQGGRDLHLARLVGGHVQIESVVRVVQVDRGGHHAVADGEDGGDRLQRSGGAQQVSGHGLGRGQHRMVTERGVQRHHLGHVPDRGGGGVRVDVYDVPGGHVRVPQGGADGASRAAAVGFGLHDVVPVRGEPGPGERGVDAGPARGGVVGALQHDDRSALPEHEPVPLLVPRAGGLLRLVVAGGPGPAG